MADPGELRGRFDRRLRELLDREGEASDAGAPTLLVALSGGRDSVVLTHLLRFGLGWPRERLRLAHLDHAWRAGSSADADWVRGLARAWGLHLDEERLEAAPRDEADARRARYAFLERTRSAEGAAWVLTAHHADDQAETVLHRAVRGTGLLGLRGIRAVDPRRRLLRPLLPFHGEALDAYARAARLRWREDPTNRGASRPRAALRHRVLPELERSVAPAARRSLARLARLAAAEAAAREELVGERLEALTLERSSGRRVLDREGLVRASRPLLAVLLRQAARELGVRLDGAGTRGAVQVTTASPSGRSVRLSGGLLVERDFDRLTLRLARAGDRRADGGGEGAAADEVVLRGERGEGELRLGGRRWRVRWDARRQADAAVTERPGAEAFDAGLGPALRVRGWRPGDRVRLSYGSKKLKKVFAEARVPARERRTLALLADRDGAVVWVPQIVRAHGSEPEPGRPALVIGIVDAGDD